MGAKLAAIMDKRLGCRSLLISNDKRDLSMADTKESGDAKRVIYINFACNAYLE